MNYFYKLILTNWLIIGLLIAPMSSFSKPYKKKASFNLKELVLPSEVKKMGKTPGAIFYSASVKGKALMPVHIWGAIGKSGLHFIPLNTTLVKGLSLAGGPQTSADLSEVKVSRNMEGMLQTTKYDLSDGGDSQSLNRVLKPGDMVFVPKDTFMSSRAYYTSLIGVAISLLSSILIYRAVKDDPTN